MTAFRCARPLRRCALSALLLTTLAAAAPAGTDEPLRAHRLGEEVTVADCVRVAVLGLTDRSGPLEPADWVSVRVRNDCDEPVRHLQVDLLLLDAADRVYGSPLWLLERGEVLWPGRSKTDRYAVRDDSEHMPRQWAVRLRTIEKPSDRRPAARPTPVPVAPPTARATTSAPR